LEGPLSNQVRSATRFIPAAPQVYIELALNRGSLVSNKIVDFGFIIFTQLSPAVGLVCSADNFASVLAEFDAQGLCYTQVSPEGGSNSHGQTAPKALIIASRKRVLMLMVVLEMLVVIPPVTPHHLFHDC
jgi:hypothetical protein